MENTELSNPQLNNKITSNSFNENIILIILASIQFTHIMDFVIMMPMNPILQQVLNINNKEFGILVSAYAASAGIFGFIAFFFIDQLDRKSALLILYLGFTISTLGCALAQSYNIFLIARMASGAFGGILGSMVFAVIGDVFSETRRGKATGIVMSAFSFASIVGIPTGLYFAVNVDWHFPFYLIAGLSTLVIILAIFYFPSLKGHVDKSVTRNPFKMLAAVFSNSNIRWALLFTFVLMLSGFSVTPYLSDYLVSNLGFTTDSLKYIYLLGGCFTVISGPFIGRISDKYGKHRIFVIVALISIIPILVITSMPPVSHIIVFTVSGLFFIFFGGRFVPAMAISTASVEKKQRGGFMSISGSFNQIASALAAFIGGLLIGEKVDGEVVNYWMVGIFSVSMTVICILLSFKVKIVS